MPTLTKQSRTQAAKPVITDNNDAWQMIDRITLLLYGRSGTGKTRFWGTFPGRTLALICSGGNKPGELRSIATPENKARITAKIVRSIDSLRTLLEGTSEYDNVVLDHVSGLQDLTLKEVLGLEELPAQKAWGMATMQQYGQSTLQCKEIARALLNLPGNVVIVGQERTFGGKEDGQESTLIQPTVGCAVTPSLAGWLSPACDYVCNTYIRAKTRLISTEEGGPQIAVREKGVEYCLRVEPNDVYAVKFRRVGNEPLTDIVNPTYAKFVAMVQGEPQPANKPVKQGDRS
jgi:hypothetical protein